MQQVTVVQAAANALALWLIKSLTSDIKVLEKWPEPDTQLPPKAVTVLKVGKRSRIPLTQLSVANVKVIGNGPLARVGYQIGSVEQPMQLDVWATSDAERDDILAQLDVALYAGIDQTLGLPGDPVRDGLLLPLLDGHDGNNCDYWFDEPQIDDTPDAVQRSEFRAILFGEARMALVVTPNEPTALIKKTVPVIKGSTDPVGS